MLNEVKTEYCSICKVGDPPQLLGYKASGSCMDYVYDKYKVPYSVALEVYTNEKIFPEMNNFINKNKQNFGNYFFIYF